MLVAVDGEDTLSSGEGLAVLVDSGVPDVGEDGDGVLVDSGVPDVGEDGDGGTLVDSDVGGGVFGIGVSGTAFCNAVEISTDATPLLLVVL